MWERELTEPSGIAHLTGGAFAVVGDEHTRSLWIVRPADERVDAIRWPRGKDAELDDLEAVVRWDERTLLATCSLGRTKNKGKSKPERGRLARIRFDEGLTAVESIDVLDGVREAVLLRLADSELSLDEVGESRPGRGGLNIEGLARVGERLFFGLREPALPDGGGVPVLELALGEDGFDDGAELRFGPLHVLPARPGEGIRSMCEFGARLIVLLGPETADDAVEFRLVTWKPGAPTATPVELPGWSALVRPEGIELVGEELFVVQDLGAEAAGRRLVRFPWPAD